MDAQVAYGFHHLRNKNTYLARGPILNKVAVRCMIFSEDGKYILSSGVCERHIAIGKIDGRKKKSASYVLSIKHPTIFLDSWGSDGSRCYHYYAIKQRSLYANIGGALAALVRRQLFSDSNFEAEEHEPILVGGGEWMEEVDNLLP